MRRIGIFSATVVDDNDQDEMRFRVKVRVNGIHHADTPVDALQWAEIIVQGASPTMGGSGDFRPYRNGDKVFVSFINGDELLPVVVGSQITRRSGVPSIPLSAVTNYVKGLLRWIRADRSGNTIELSEAPNERHVAIRSGGAEIRVSRIGDTVSIKAIHGKVRVEGAKVDVISGSTVVKSSNVVIDAVGENLLSLPNGQATLRSNDTVDIVTDNPLSVGGIPNPASTDEINIGCRVDRLAGVAVPPPAGKPPTQTAKNNLRAQFINIGVGPLTNLNDFAGLPPIPLPPTLNVSIRSTMGVSIQTSGTVSVAAGVSASVTAPIVSLSAVAQLTIQSAAKLDILAGGVVNVSATGALTVQAASLSFLTIPAAPPIVLPPVI